MSAAPLTALVRRLAPNADAIPDADLLGRFVRSGDSAAFELLVWRHGAMVWGACLRILTSDRAAAEDACQAAFVALAVYAARVRDRAAVAALLHRVAVRAALDLRATRTRTRGLADDEPADPAADPFERASAREVRALLDAGVNRLPDKFRQPFILCELEGRSNAEAAAALGCAVGTVESRLSRARQKLRAWLTARGVVPAVLVTATALPDSVRAALVRAGLPGAVGPTVDALAARAARAVRATAGAKLRLTVACGLILAASVFGLGMATGPRPAPTDPPATSARAQPPDEAKPPARADADPVPAGAVRRLGSTRLRHPGWVKDLCYSPTGRHLASVGFDNTVCVWSAETGARLFVVRRGEGVFEQVAFANGGKSLVVAGTDPDRQLDLWRVETETGRVVARVEGPARVEAAAYRGRAIPLRFNPDGSRIAMGVKYARPKLLALDDDSRFMLGVEFQKRGQLLMVDTVTGEKVWGAELAAPPGGRIAFAPDGRTVVAGTAGGSLDVFDADGKAIGSPGGPPSGNSGIHYTMVELSPDGKMVVERSDCGAWGGLSAWDRATGERLWSHPLKGGDGAAFTPDSRSLVVLSCGNEPGVIDAADGALPGTPGKKAGVLFEGMWCLSCVTLHPNGKVAAFGTQDGAICQFDVATGKPASPTADPPQEVRKLRFSPDGRTVYGWAGAWYAWDVNTGEQTRRTTAALNTDPIASRDMPLSPDGKFVARHVWHSEPGPGGSPGCRLEITVAETGAVVRSHADADFKNYGWHWREFTPDGKAVVVQSYDGAIRVRSIESGRDLARGAGHADMSGFRALSADGRVLVTGTRGNPPHEPFVFVWDLTSGKQIAKLNPGTYARGLAVSADGARVAASAYTNATLWGKSDPRHLTTVWDVASGTVLARVPQGGDAECIALSPDGRLVAVSAQGKGDVRVYEVASEAERFHYRHEGEITGLAFAPDGRVLAAASKEAPIILWDVTGDRVGKLPPWDVAAAAVWDDLAAKDAARALRAIRSLRANPDKAVALLREKVVFPAAPGAEALARFFAELDSEDPPTRERATEALAAYGESVRAALGAEAKRSASAEARLRLTKLLARLDASTPARLRLIRAVEVVEGIGGPAAKELLEAWASGPGGPLLSAEAKAALARRPR